MSNFQEQMEAFAKRLRLWDAELERFAFERRMIGMRIRHKVALIIHAQRHNRTGINLRIAAKKFLSQRRTDNQRARYRRLQTQLHNQTQNRN